MNAPIKPAPQLERAEGKLEISVQNKGHGNTLKHLMQDGCLKARFPAMHTDGPKRGVLINTTGGIADGDCLQTLLKVEDTAAIALTTQAAERIYRARQMNNPAQMDTCFNVGSDAHFFWFPQETILFDGSAATRKFTLDMAKNASFLGGEMVVLGRTAMQEKVTSCNLFDSWRIRVDDKLVFADGFRLEGPLESIRGPAQLAEAIAYATVFVVGPKAKASQEAIREILAGQSEIMAGCSLREPVLICRFAATESKKLITLLCSIFIEVETRITGSSLAAQAILPRWIY